ncbi:hypothetical protein BS47DRAFT_1371801 [Hydnum rufescens UP504]|uniref:CxC2-like cysteine cluster KDZ transposase-associated domain-containing protein n=1 Tax=Hydnum rufescens UP504 TaxID=1448309 RepID=A0A9P6B2J0_9AGAM|nr:hypothetical protein BS47DRAFT_1371801 [Hydnum rufescens UP504]
MDPLHDEYLDSMLWCDSQHESLEILGCPACQEAGSSGIYHCEECFNATLHENLPLHWIKVSMIFSYTVISQILSICTLGMEWGVFYPYLPTFSCHFGTVCPSPCCGPLSFMVIHMQLMHHEWFPATVHQLQTCATFQVLHHFHLLSLQSKISTIHFYNSRYTVFLQVMCKYCHLKMLKHGGHRHNPTRVKGTRNGKLTVLCPVCPHPSIHLPDDWGNALAHLKFLNSLMLTIDANFHLKNRLTSGMDPSLSSGWAYFVGNKPYKEYIKAHVTENDISTCSRLQALDHANTKSSKGLCVTGIVVSMCPCHGFLLPQGLRDLQKGEQYCNIDYIVFSSLQIFTVISLIVFSYDILPAHIQVDCLTKSMWYIIPKFHMNGHHKKCHLTFSLNLLPGSGQTDGEGVEHDWEIMNSAANSTKEMSEGSRHDTLNDLWGDWNYWKVMIMGKALFKKYNATLVEHEKQHEQFNSFTEGLPLDDVREWEVTVCAWEMDQSKPNPYDILAMC